MSPNNFVNADLFFVKIKSEVIIQYKGLEDRSWCNYYKNVILS
jgi:hypothetical protein